VNGEVAAEATGATRLSAWWTMVLGQHSFWLEGEKEPGGPTLRSQVAQIAVQPFQNQDVTLTAVK
jgi:hypothetical protein